MGQFSWKYSNSNKAMLDDVCHDSFLLVPTEFQVKFGRNITEPCYGGYGMFCNYDVYDLVAFWNKEWIAENPDHQFYNNGIMKDYDWYTIIKDAKDIKDFHEFKNFVQSEMAKRNTNGFHELRTVGIAIACYDEDNGALKYPIKIVDDYNLNYEDVDASDSDENQGWGSEEDNQVFVEDITGVLGEWLDMDTDYLPNDVLIAIEKAYRVACEYV